MSVITHDPLYLEYFDLFKQKKFFECHEVLEELWLRDASSSRDFYKGLIQLAAALHHVTKGNKSGAQYLHESSFRYLKTYQPSHLDLDLSRLIRDFEVYFNHVFSGNLKQPVPELHLNPKPGAKS